MTTLTQFSAHPLVHALGWTLLHFLWQGAVAALMLWLVLALFGGGSSQARYSAACFALALLVAMPVVTFAHIASSEYRIQSLTWDAAVPIDAGMVLQVGAGEPDTPWPARMAVELDRLVPWLLTAWFSGAAFFVVRLNFGLMVARRLQSAETQEPARELNETFEVLRLRLGVERVVKLLHSARVQVPTVIGWLRPVVLIPASCLTGLSTVQIEAILCHELAHVRRHDYLVSVFQSVAESLLFYHPAVWWVSKQVRRERECCCDEIAVGAGGDVIAYARALSYLEERRAAFPEFVLGANGGVLTMRIKRLLGSKEDAVGSPFAAFVVLGAMVVAAGSYFVTVSRAQEKTTQAAVASSTAQPAASEDGQEARAVARDENGPIVRYGISQPRIAFNADRPVAAKVSVQPDMSCSYYGGVPFREYAGTCEEDRTNAGHYSCRSGEDRTLIQTQAGCEWKVKRFKEWQQKNEVPPALSLKNTDGYAQGMAQVLATSMVGSRDEAARGTENPGVIQGVGLDQTRALASPTLQSASHQPAVNLIAHYSRHATFYNSFTQGGKTDGSNGSNATQGTGSIAGVIIDPTGAVVPRADVKIVNTDTGLTMTRVTDNAGSYSLAPLPPGPYNVEVEAKGFQRLLQENVQVKAGQTAGVNLKLSVGTATENLIVTVAPAAASPKPPNQVLVPVQPATGKPLRVSSGVMAGNIISKVDPVYPPDAKAAHVQGVVVLHATISKLGTIEEVEVICGPPALIVSSVDAVRQWKYKPYLLNGEPSKVETTININYTFEKSPDAQGQGCGADNPDTATTGPKVDSAGIPVRRIGGSVSPPMVIYQAEPEFTEEARKAKFMGVVLVGLIVNENGLPEDVHVMRGVGLGLNDKAVDAVKQYKFRPAMQDGKPVPVALNMEVNFQIF